MITTMPSRRLPAVSVPKSGKTVRLIATDAERATIAAELGLASCEMLDADLLITPARGDSLHVTGQLKASLHQTCIVSLEAFPVDINETIDSRFAPPERLSPITKAEVERTLEDEDPPEPLDDGNIDLWALVIDYFTVALDPYPRKSGAEVSGIPEPEARESPFSALASLKSALEKG